jgi:hypothetical protein
MSKMRIIEDDEVFDLYVTKGLLERVPSQVLLTIANGMTIEDKAECMVKYYALPEVVFIEEDEEYKGVTH